MGRARTRFASRLDLAALRQKATQPSEVLVINLFDLVDAELADLTTRRELASATAGAVLARASTPRTA